ncbi:MAG: glycerol-3-phosphate dehydrogenase/oxidase [Thermoflavifilum sp.]|nr:glycerol-3-phosphate dehydrogenase/oxidase [Thermoflavifilum sp.]
MNREIAIQRIREVKEWDIVVVGGGATGLGVAVDAATRGFQVLLVEQHDFAKGTSSRSTKLIHGGVRYLAQGNVQLVKEGLQERGYLLQNAPHLVRPLAFVIPIYSWKDAAMLWAGMKLYDMLAGKWRIGKSEWLSRAEVIEVLPGVRANGLIGGVRYYDAQFDDARMAIHLAQTCVDAGGTVVNYMQAEGWVKDASGQMKGVRLKDKEMGQTYEVRARAVINATGVFVDKLIQLDEPRHPQLVQPSQGVHIVLPGSWIGSSAQAMLIPKTTDGRVVFLVPWHGFLLAGTTDTPVNTYSLEPKPLPAEIDFILDQIATYLIHRPTRSDISSVFAGLRPLAVPQKAAGSTKDISRKHYLQVNASGLITITGGKWTTYRKMAEDTVDCAIRTAGLSPRNCLTRTWPIHGWQLPHDNPSNALEWNVYGADWQQILSLQQEDPSYADLIIQNLPYRKAQVIWAVRFEMARTVEDVLARRLRVLFVDARAALQMAPVVAEIMQQELHQSNEWKTQQIDQFQRLAQAYLSTNG